RLVEDLRTDDFENLRAKIAQAWGRIRLGNEIQRVRSVFKYGYDAGYIDQPMRFGPGFKRPSNKTLREERNAKGERMFEADQIRAMLAVVGPQLKAMILLACNGGLGNHDVATLPKSALDLKRGWCKFPRPKTAVKRRFPLWP